jgi:hypothetical protein
MQKIKTEQLHPIKTRNIKKKKKLYQGDTQAGETHGAAIQHRFFFLSPQSAKPEKTKPELKSPLLPFGHSRPTKSTHPGQTYKTQSRTMVSPTSTVSSFFLSTASATSSFFLLDPLFFFSSFSFLHPHT